MAIQPTTSLLGMYKESRGTAAEWAATNKPIPAGFRCVESDTRRVKIGNGVQLYSALPYSEYLSVSKLIGEVFAIWDHITGVLGPDNTEYARYIKLSAGASGTGGYNAGLLSDEAVSGTAPYISATAKISLTDSPLYNVTVRLINTERRFIRPGESGVLADDTLKSHSHAYVKPVSALLGITDGDASYSAAEGDTTDATGGSETAPRNIGATYYMRIR